MSTNHPASKEATMPSNQSAQNDSTQTDTKETLMTPYAATKIVNAILTENGLKAIPPQMMYNYTKKGYIPSENGRITEESLMTWLAKYLTKKGVELTVTSTEE